MIAYTVTATFANPRIADEWVAWLREEHLAEVLAAGALDGEVIRMDGAEHSAVRCEVRYHFASRESFEAYERDHASRLRTQGLERFPPERGIQYQRTVGQMCVSLPS
jgi:hypothetical protein